MAAPAARAPAPQDTTARESSPLRGTVDELAARHRAASTHDERAHVLWALVAHGEAALPWCAQALRATDEDVGEDAAGVVMWIGATPELIAILLERFQALDDSQARDAIVAALPAAERAALFTDDDAAADAGTDFVPEEVWFVEAPYEQVVAAYRDSSDDPRGHFSEHRKDETGRITSYGDVALWLQDGEQWRTIQATRGDSGWSWHLDGVPQDFEDLARYEARRITQRFDHALLLEYCRRLGIQREQPSFYGPRALLHEAGWARKRR